MVRHEVNFSNCVLCCRELELKLTRSITQSVENYFMKNILHIMNNQNYHLTCIALS